MPHRSAGEEYTVCLGKKGGLSVGWMCVSGRLGRVPALLSHPSAKVLDHFSHYVNSDVLCVCFWEIGPTIPMALLSAS